MRPFRTFLLLLIFLACFTGLYYIAPGYIRLPDINSFIPADITALLADKLVASKPDTLPKTKALLLNPDTTQIRAVDTIKSNPVISIPSPLSALLDSLKDPKGQVRIMYYGDSQIEGDRITSYLRQTLRKQAGGAGPGLFLPLMPVMYTRSMNVRSSGNWTRYNYLSFKNHEIPNRDLGPFMTICRYLPPGSRSAESVKATVRIVPSVFADSLDSKYDILRIIYKNEMEDVGIRISDADKLILTDSLKAGSDIEEIAVSTSGSKDIRIEFTGKVSPDIYCMSLESSSGVIVDNIPQRGSAGMEFTMVGRENLKQIYKKLKPDLFILHYGLNIVHNVRDDYSYYENGLLRQIDLLKNIYPEADILVVSLTDMAYREGDSIRSFKNISKIRDAQREAARKAGVTFWDAYQAMGSENSAIRWEEMKTPLMQKDFVHFTSPGADSISKLLCNAIFSVKINDSIKPVHVTPDSSVALPSVVKPAVNKANTGKGLAVVIAKDIFTYDPANPFIFTTEAFWLFFLIVLAGYSIVYRKLTIRNVYLFIISLFFYFKTGGLFLFLLIFVTVMDFTCGILIHKTERRSLRKFVLLISLVSNLGLLSYFKYSSFFIETINSVFGTDLRVYDMLSVLSNSLLGTSFDISYIILPVGISFFTFQSLSYTIDVYRRKMDPVRNIIDFGFYVSFFPHLVAGPIVRASVFIPQIYQDYHLTKNEFSHALFMISKGLIKKIVISNFIAINFVDRIFDTPGLFSGFENLMAIYGYGLQIYCDFSGYTDIAIGVALLLGFRLPVNFNSPYKAASITDFWKRWHISLSQWLKDYLYISLGGNRKGRIRTCFNLMLTMLLGGLWHGASLRFIIWGALHGVGLVVHKIWSATFGRKLNTGRPGKILAILLTFNFVSFCWVFFRSESMDNIMIMFRQIIYNFYPGSYETILQAYGNVFLLICLGYLIHLLPEKTKEAYRGVFIKIPVVVQLLVVMVVAVMLYQMKSTEILPFIYFRF